MTDDLTCKLIDFGLSRAIEGGSSSLYMTRQAGTSQYMAPEVTLTSRYNEKCDIFSYGIMLYEIMTEDFEPYGVIEFNLELKVALNPDFRPQIDQNPFSDQENTEWVVALMKRCWDVDVDVRPSFSEILEELTEKAPATIEALAQYQEELSLQFKERQEKKLLFAAKAVDSMSFHKEEEKVPTKTLTKRSFDFRTGL